MSQLERRNEESEADEEDETFEKLRGSSNDNIQANHNHPEQTSINPSSTMNKNMILCSILLLINLAHLIGSAEAGRLHDFFQSLVGNPVGLGSVLSSALLAANPGSSHNNQNDHQLANHKSNPSFVSPSRLISQRTSVSWSPDQFNAVQQNALESVSFDLDTASSSNQVSSHVIHPGDESKKLIGREETTALMSPMMPSISPYLRYYRYSRENFAPVVSPRYGGPSTASLGASSQQPNSNAGVNVNANPIAATYHSSLANPMSAMSRMSPMVAMQSGASNNNENNVHVVQQRNSVMNNNNLNQQQQSVQIFPPIGTARLNNNQTSEISINKWATNPINRQSGGLSSPAALASSPLSSMFDVFGAASQYLLHFKPSSFIGQPGTLQMPILTSHLPQIIEHNQQQQHLMPFRNNNYQQQQQHRHAVTNNQEKKTSTSTIINSDSNAILDNNKHHTQQLNGHPNQHHHYQQHQHQQNIHDQGGNNNYAIQQQQDNNLTNEVGQSSSTSATLFGGAFAKQSSVSAASSPVASSPFPVVHFATSNYTKSPGYQAAASSAIQHLNPNQNLTSLNLAATQTSPSTSTATISTTSPAALALSTSPANPQSQQGFFSRLVSSSFGLMSGQSSGQSGNFQRREDVCGRTIQAPERRIIGGEGARYGEFPYQVHIKIAKHQCGGALVDRQSIVTAAHCVYHFITRAPVNKLQIVIGAYDIEDEQYQELPPQYFKVNKVKLHPNFRFSASHPDRYDVAILKLDKPVKYTDNVLPVCLPARDLNFESMIGTVTGFGKTDPSLSNRYGTRLLQKVDVPIIENSECERWHRTRGIDLKIFPEMMCAGYEDGLKDACVGDSGGPLVVKSAAGPNGATRWTLAGITSAGFGCAQSRQPGIYHRVSHTVDWILENLD